MRVRIDIVLRLPALTYEVSVLNNSLDTLAKGTGSDLAPALDAAVACALGRQDPMGDLAADALVAMRGLVEDVTVQPSVEWS